ncbi:uncharacterized protein LOC131062948 [Cryptomeria japonica]|uniref:uncharacterized protein LOC131062948 n=1 Tax=Cryptomeria japonica TaxID=3369 RepID=UPI0027DA6477|nr:uncharacterized protein LOC131062948 [Cryptomeria japonica]
MEPTKRSGKQTQINQEQITKRSKVKGQNAISIEDLNARKAGNIFEGDVLIVYKATLDKVNKSRPVLLADLTDLKAEMTIIVNVTGDLVENYEEKIVPNSAICISGFDIAPKTDYDRGDSDCILILKDSTTIETMPRMCQEYNFIPSTTIKQLRFSTNEYPIGTIGALVTRTGKQGSQYTLDIKDGDNETHKVQLYLHQSFGQQCLTIEDHLQMNEIPPMLFRNVVKKVDQRITFRTSLSTFICKLNDKRTLERLNGLLNTTYEVDGILKVANPFSVPFHAFCPQCNYKFENYGMLEDNSAHCTRCHKKVNYVYSLQLNTILTAENKETIQCSLDKSTVEQLLPALQNTTYEDYKEDKSRVIFILRDFTTKGHFTLNQNNLITHAFVLHE